MIEMYYIQICINILSHSKYFNLQKTQKTQHDQVIREIQEN